ncbi:MAG: exodeoxyribonuclease VII large subunit [Streptococcaceae bacterium]|jgi:exodeoxyribonuclease VII large subunit|nr:exodeoxyribonuclease VII large subunit [Streptococcaceae bacterium]
MAEYLSISTLTKYLKAKFDRDPYLERVFVTGEVSGFRQRPSHQYFKLKDAGAVISATMWAGNFNKLKFQLEDGMKVNAIGRVELYAPGGSYAIIIEELIPDGIGALAVKFEQLKQKLTAEGLFSENFKQTLPQFSRKVGVITSPSGAVIRDIITTIDRRFPLTEILLFPTKVQGDGAAEEIATNIRAANAQGDLDLLIVGRGGGSIEDLWCFNEEVVVRAIFESKLPVISSVGHETDVTLADFVADRRAATPTAAAELATPNTKTDLLGWTAERQNRLYQSLSRLIKQKSERLEKAAQSVVFRQPERLYDGHKQRVDELTGRLSALTEKKRLAASHQFGILAQRLIPAFQKSVEQKKNRVLQASQALLLLDVSKIKARGFAIVRDEQNKILKSVSQVKTGDTLAIELEDGVIKANAN